TREWRRAPIAAVMYGPFAKNGAGARKFGAEVAGGGGEYTENALATILDAWLKAMGEKGGAKTGVKPANLYQGCVFAWNAYREGKTISTIKFDTKKGLYAASE